MGYSKGCHTTFHHRYHIVWAPKYRYKVLIGAVRLRVREIIKQVCDEMGVTIINGALSKDHVHMFVEIPPHIAVSDFVRRANPLQQPGSYTLNFGGIDLTFEPDKTYRNLWGPTIGAQYEKEFSSGLTLAASAAYRSLPGDAADRLTADFTLGKRVGTSPLELKVGAVRLGQKYQSFTLPYVQATYTFSLSQRSAIQPSARVGYYFADSGRGMSGWQADLFVPYVHTPNPAKAFAVGPTILRHDVGFPEQSYTSFGLRAVATMRSDKVNVEAGLQGRITRFDAVDPFWGARRKEKGLFGSLMLSSDRVRIGPFTPAVGVSCDITRSTIRYYQQSSCDGLFEVRKLF